MDGPTINRPRHKALIFDCDGVLVDSEPLHASSWSDILRRHGLDFRPADMERFIGMTSPQMLEVLIDKEKVFSHPDRKALIAERRLLFFEMLPGELREIPGAGAFLRFAARHATLALATSNPTETFSRILNQMGWLDCFAVRVGSNDVKRTKPAPDIYLTALARLELPAAECLVFEDSVPGVLAAREAGLEVVGIASSFAPGDLVAAGACDVLRDFTDNEAMARVLNHTGGA